MSFRLNDIDLANLYVKKFGIDSGLIFNVELDNVRTCIHNIILNQKKELFELYFTFSNEFCHVFLVAFYLVDKYNKQVKELHEFENNGEAFYTLFFLLWADYFNNRKLHSDIKIYKNKIKMEQEKIQKIKDFVKKNTADLLVF